MRLEYTDEQEELRAKLRAQLEAVMTPERSTAVAGKMEGGAEAEECVRALADAGLLGVGWPKQYGGQGYSAIEQYIFFEEAKRVSAPLPIVTLNTVGPTLMAFGTDEQKEQFLPAILAGTVEFAIGYSEPDAGSDLAALRTTAVRDGDEYVINGAKTFISNGINADAVVTAVRTGDDPHQGLSMIVIERGMEGFERGKQIHKRGQHANDTAELYFNDCRVPAENLLGEEGTGFAQLMAHLIPERLGLSVSSLAGSEAALDLTLDYVKERKAFGRPIGSFQNSRFVLAELQTKVTITRTWLDTVIQKFVDGTCTVQEAAMAKYWTTDLGCEVADAGVQLFGGYGYTEEYKISEFWVDARVNRIYAGTNEIMKELVGRSMGL